MARTSGVGRGALGRCTTASKGNAQPTPGTARCRTGAVWVSDATTRRIPVTPAADAHVFLERPLQQTCPVQPGHARTRTALCLILASLLPAGVDPTSQLTRRTNSPSLAVAAPVEAGAQGGASGLPLQQLLRMGLGRT